MNISEKLGTRVKLYREKLGLSIEELAKNAGVDSALVSNIEEGNTYPSINVLVKLSRSLGQRLGTFTDDQFREDPVIVRMDERHEDTLPHRGMNPNGYHYYLLGKGKTDRHMDPFFIKIEPSEDVELSSHEGEEFIIVVSGEIVLRYGQNKYHLKEGDSVYYNSVVPHHVGAANDSTASIYAVVYMPA
ncbi:MAG: cupin domain-containing protein [Euryarchaeota archaeon]|nr:cupin domain-containing protein [Euryarchaeota archaeon]